MTLFPSLIPSSRVFTPGEYPHTAFRAWNGLESRVRHSNVMLASTLRLTFVSLTEANMLSILSHYTSKQGEFLPFPIPSQLLSGVSAAADYTLTGYQWRYAEPPVVDDIPCAGHSVEVLLESVPFEAISLSGLDAQVFTTFAPGAPAAANGINSEITVDLTAGLPFTPGADLSFTLSLDDGSAAGAAAMNGADEVIDWQFASGGATVLATPSHSWSTAGGTASLSSRLGFKFTVGGRSLSCVSLGIYGASSGSEKVIIHRVSDGVAIATANITSSAGAWVDSNITPVTLSSGVAYKISAQRVDGSTRSVYLNPSGLSYNAAIGSVSYWFGSNDSQPSQSTSSAYAFVRFGFT